MSKKEIKIVEEGDRNRGLITAAVFITVVLILLLFLSISEPNPPLKDIPVVIELSPEMIMEPSASGSDGGAKKSGSVDPKPTPPDQGDPVLTSKKPKPVQHNSGTSGNKPVKNPNPPQQQPDPTFTFPGGGSGGSGGNGNGSGFGEGTGGAGDGTGTGGTGTGGNRKKIKDACKPDNTSEDGTIYLTIYIDEYGKVVRADNIASKSTTSSVSVIDAARRAVMCERYESIKGAAVQKKEVRIQIRSN